MVMGIVVAITIIGILVWLNSLPATITFSKIAYESNGESWSYEMSNSDVLKEIKYRRGILGSADEWTFEQIGEGEVTIKWIAWRAGIYNERDSYSITYYFDEDGTYTILEDTREAK